MEQRQWSDIKTDDHTSRIHLGASFKESDVVEEIEWTKMPGGLVYDTQLVSYISLV